MMELQVKIEIDEGQLRELIRQLLADRGDVAAPSGGVELPGTWRRVEERKGVTYTWGDDQMDAFDPFVVYEGTTSSGLARLGIGRCVRTLVHSEERIYYIVCAIGPQGGLRAIAEFLATDDYAETGDVIAIVKGKEGTGRQFDPGDELPPVYERWASVTYRDRVDYPGSYKKIGLVCNELDHETMLNHALAQIQLRGLDA
jgi:hypothetical protein